jgi:hypothetical protein
MLCMNGIRHNRVASIRPEHDLCAFADGLAFFRLALHADDASVLDQDAFDGEVFADVHSGFGRCIDEQLVQNGTPRAIGDRKRPGSRCAFDRERAKIEGVGLDGRATGRNEAVEQAPSRQRRHGKRVHHVGGYRVARKGRPVHQQDSVAFSREQHCSRRTCAACSDNDGIIGLAHS